MDQTERLFDRFNIKPVLGVIPNNQDPELLSYPKKKIRRQQAGTQSRRLPVWRARGASRARARVQKSPELREPPPSPAVHHNRRAAGQPPSQLAWGQHPLYGTHTHKELKDGPARAHQGLGRGRLRQGLPHAPPPGAYLTMRQSHKNKKHT